MREIARRLRELERRNALAFDYTAEQWARLSDEDLGAMSKLPVKADGMWDVERWTDEHRAFADAICFKARGETA
jgi:hypothetical protein